MSSDRNSQLPEVPESFVMPGSPVGGRGRYRQRSAARVSPGDRASVRRACARNTMRAQQRLVALSLLADGHMHPSEVDLLCGPQAAARLFASETKFLAALAEFCADIRRMPVSGGHYAVSHEYVERLLAEVSEPSQRRATLNLMFDVIRSDGRLDRHEAALLWNALDAWGLRVSHLGRCAVGRD